VSKILVFSVLAHGHVNPTLPVVRELVSRGEQAAYYLTGEFEPQIRHIGAERAASRTFNQVPVTLGG
jgi:UDP:flavonoid glycosyltransferase YjiC (YdhE family)